MKRSISNIAWQASQDDLVFDWMQQYGFSGLEIAPTRIFPENPYECSEEATAFANGLMAKREFVIPSIQSIWYGRKENIFNSEEHRTALCAYTQKAIHFASSCGASNLVFGCPSNRNKPEDADVSCVIPFFRQIADYALEKNCVIALEANPTIYNTNFMNTTPDAIEFARVCNHKAIKINLDLGTIIHNQESLDFLDHAAELIHHVHISEPGLAPIVPRNLHRELAEKLHHVNYNGFISIEMKRVDDLNELKHVMEYVSSIFG